MVSTGSYAQADNEPALEEVTVTGSRGSGSNPTSTGMSDSPLGRFYLAGVNIKH